MKPRNLLILAGMTALLSSEIAAADNLQLKKYQRAVRNAAVANQDEIVQDLVPITPDNSTLVWNADRTKVKVVTWKSQGSYANNIAPYTETSPDEAYVIWVTMAPRIHDFCHGFLQSHPRAGQKALDLRLKQRLGLHPEWRYDVFVELWVDPADLFRPCVDPNPTDSRCELNFGGTLPQVKNIKDYGSFYKSLYYSDFRAAPGVPWTGLGYTYDWSQPHRVEGESEFILAPSSPYAIEQAVPTWQYCSR